MTTMLPYVTNCRRMMLVLLSLIGAPGIQGCAHGRFVGASYVPTQTYAGDERPDVELSSVGAGVHMGPKAGSAVVIGNEVWHAVVVAVDGTACSGGCNSVVQMLPGAHILSVVLHSSPSASGQRVQWNESKPFDVSVTVDKGVAYNVMPALQPDGAPGAVLKTLCASTDHIDTIKQFQQWGELSCK